MDRDSNNKMSEEEQVEHDAAEFARLICDIYKERGTKGEKI